MRGVRGKGDVWSLDWSGFETNTAWAIKYFQNLFVVFILVEGTNSRSNFLY